MYVYWRNVRTLLLFWGVLPDFNCGCMYIRTALWFTSWQIRTWSSRIKETHVFTFRDWKCFNHVLTLKWVTVSHHTIYIAWRQVVIRVSRKHCHQPNHRQAGVSTHYYRFPPNWSDSQLTFPKVQSGVETLKLTCQHMTRRQRWGRPWPQRRWKFCWRNESTRRMLMFSIFLPSLLHPRLVRLVVDPKMRMREMTWTPLCPQQLRRWFASSSVHQVVGGASCCLSVHKIELVLSNIYYMFC